jgi:hypothetical protein
MDFEAKAREVCGALGASAPRPEAVVLVADALRAAAADDDARREARAELTRLLAEVKARAVNPPLTLTADWHSEPQSTPLADIQAVAQAAQAHGGMFDGRTHEQAFLESLAAYQSARPSAPPHGRQATFSPSALAGLLRRLLWLLGLSGGERRFVAALADDAADFDMAQVYADWLEDDGRTAAGARLRRLVPRDGDVLVFTVATGPDAAAESRACEKAAGRLADILAARGVRCTPVVAYHGTDVSALPQQTMRAAGWVRAEAVRSSAARVDADCETHPDPRFREGAGNALARVLAALGDAP